VSKVEGSGNLPSAIRLLKKIDMSYKVRLHENDYEIIDKEGKQQFKGGLADCIAWLQLNDKGYLN